VTLLLLLLRDWTLHWSIIAVDQSLLSYQHIINDLFWCSKQKPKDGNTFVLGSIANIQCCHACRLYQH
jgi:hypothetical protein